jgi:hypothetical protein
MTKARQLELPDPKRLYETQRMTAIWFLSKPAVTHARTQQQQAADPASDLSHARDWWNMAKGIWTLHAENVTAMKHEQDGPCTCPSCTELAYPSLTEESKTNE